MADRSKDWMRQADRDLAHACRARDAGDHEWSCFAAHQAAEKAVKALAISLGGEPWGHSVSTLLGALEAASVPPELLDRSKVLDKHYIQPRYPNGFDSGAPGDYYTREEAETAISNAEAIIEFCRNHMG
jgi:HEPN domain-containing protein